MFVSILILLFGFIIHEILQSRIIFNNTKMEKISNIENSQIFCINNFLNTEIKINQAYSIDKIDTIISFEYDDRSGLFWTSSNMKCLDLTKMKITIDKHIVNMKNGTYISFISEINPSINILYKYRKIIKDGYIDMHLSPGTEYYYDSINNVNDVWKFILSRFIDIYNSQGQSVFRIEFGKETELYLLKQNNATRFLFVQ